MRKIRKNEVGKVVFEITEAAESRSGTISAMVRTYNKFERWWQAELVSGLAAAPYRRTPGWSIEEDADVVIESKWEAADRRFRFAREQEAAGREAAKQLDLLVRRKQNSDEYHLVELKLINGSASRPEQWASMRRDIQALKTMRGWDETGSCWAVAMAFHHGGKRAVLAHLQPICDEEGVDAPVVHRLRTTTRAGKVWIAAVRVA